MGELAWSYTLGKILANQWHKPIILCMEYNWSNCPPMEDIRSKRPGCHEAYLIAVVNLLGRSDLA